VEVSTELDPRDERVLRVRKLRALQAVAALDESRALRRLTQEVGAAAVASALDLTEAQLAHRLDEAGAPPSVAAGFSGANAYEIAQRYAVGQLSRDRAVDELSRWPYRPEVPGDGVDWLSGERGEWSEVERALREGLLDPELYDAVLDRRS
jgi:hypothetical protein